MGMPISFYSTLLGITSHDEPWLSRRAEEALRPFSRFAFVIHDPGTHPDFDAALNASFDDLDQSTGEKLLFFALVRPESADGIQDLKQRSYYQFFKNEAKRSEDWVVPQQLASPDAVPAAPDPSLSAWSFATCLGIPYEALPCIVTTADLQGREIEVYPTTAGTLVKQLTELGKTETRRRRREELADPRQKSFFPDSSHCLTKSLAATLRVVLGGIYASDHGSYSRNPSQVYDPQKNALNRSDANAAEYRATFLTSLIDLLNDLKRAPRPLDDGELPQEFQQLGLAIAGVLQALAAPEPDSVPLGLANPPRGLFERETGIMLKTALRCLAVLRAPPPWLKWHERMSRQRRFDPVDDMHGCERTLHETDFTPSLICLAKAFENEINLSVVQWVRQRLGVSLPEHFKQVQRGVIARYVPTSVVDGRPIDFNQSRNGHWLPPGLGQSEMACEELARECPPLPFNEEMWRRFMQAWRVIRVRRNDAAHPYLVHLHECEQVVAEMTALIDGGVFQASTDLKRLLRGEQDSK